MSVKCVGGATHVLSEKVIDLDSSELIDRFEFNLGGDLIVRANLDRCYQHVEYRTIDTEVGTASMYWGVDWDCGRHCLGIYRRHRCHGLEVNPGPCTTVTGIPAVEVRYDDILVLRCTLR